MLLATAFVLSVRMMDLETMTVKIDGHLAEYKMVKVPGGKFGFHEDMTEVKPFWIGTTEVTWDLYDIFAYRLDLSQEVAASDEVIKARPSKPYGEPDRGYGHAGYPAIGIHINAAQAFCKWLSEKTGKKFRLPTEAEWEYAAMAGTSDVPSPLDEYAWNWDNADDQTHPVGSLKANAWGLHDMLGNASEWVTLPEDKTITKGGHFYSKPKTFAFTMSEQYRPEWQMRDAHTPKSKWWLSDGEFVGLRLVCEAE
jgi:formylglycine-generating enzyme required for sulfatase activity